jgi:hypothetical protein
MKPMTLYGKQSYRERKMKIHPYDEFFRSRNRVTGIRFIGLLILGISFTAAGLFTLTMLILKVKSWGLSGFFLMGLGIGILGPVVYFGWLHLRRAFAGRL